MKKIILSLLLTLFTVISHAAGLQGLNYETFASSGGSPSIAGRPVLTTGVVNNVNFQWGGGSILNTGRGDGVIVHFYGFYKVPGSGPQTFYFGIDSDDGQRLSINNTLLVDCWCDQGSGFRSGTITLQGGSVVPIDIWYYENGGGAFVVTYWYNPAVGWEPIPASNLATDSTFWGPVYTSDITPSQTITVNEATVRRDAIQIGNSIYIDQRMGSSNNTVIIDQRSNYNSIQGIGGSERAVIDGSNNNITIRQGDPYNLTGKNLLEFSVVGNYNTVSVNQARTVPTGIPDSQDTNGHIQSLNITGSFNTISTQQANTAVGPHYMNTAVSGSNNNMDLRQVGDNTKRMFSNILGNYNALNVTQTDNGQHYLDITLVGNSNSVNIMQKDSGSHRATINLTNAGGPSILNLTQQGTTAQVYNITQQCANLAGCSVSVTQGGGP